MAPSAVAFSPDYHTPRAMTRDDIDGAVADFAAAAERALAAGFEVIELHAAHGYLAHQFLSPLSNQRDDEYGGSFANRVRFVREMTAGRARRLAGAPAAVRPHLGHRLGRRRMDARRVGRTGAAAEARRRGLDRLLLRRFGGARAAFPSARATRCRSRNASAKRQRSQLAQWG